MPLFYDSAVAYDTPLYTYDGDFLGQTAIGLKEAIYRELKYSVLDGLNVKLDMNLSARSLKDAYPFVLFRRVTSNEDNQVRYARERFEIEVVGRHTDPNAGDDQVEEIVEAILASFAGQHRTFGQFDSDGEPNSLTGLRTHCRHINTVPNSDDEEIAQIVILVFTYIRP